MFHCINKKTNPLITAANNNTLHTKLRSYLNACKPGDDEKAKKKSENFPNLAGFCRRLGCGISAFEELQSVHAELADWICAVFEDETLNASLSPTLLGAYMKKRLGYTEKVKSEESSAECGPVQLIFEHDIMEDGS